jgi:predicted nucleic acid-binding protein
LIVVDASVLMPALVDEGEKGDRMRARLDGEWLTAPSVVDLEVIAALRGIVRGGEVTARRAERALEDLVSLPLDRAPHRRLARRIWELRDNLTAYDASYVALAERLDTVLLTADAALARAPGIECEIELLRQESEPRLPG